MDGERSDEETKLNCCGTWMVVVVVVVVVSRINLLAKLITVQNHL